MISVCLATYNGEKYVLEQLNSILSQLGDEDEVIISDDSSTDKTIELIEGLRDNRIHIYKHESIGETSFIKAKNNFINALEHAKGDYIFLADQDDIWNPKKVQMFMSFLLSYDCVQSDCELMSPSPYTTGSLTQYSSLLCNIIHLPFRGCNMAITRKHLDRILPIPESVITHDAWIGCCGVACNSYVRIEEKLLHYRIHDNNVSVCKSKNSLWYKIYYRIAILYHVVKRCYLKIL